MRIIKLSPSDIHMATKEMVETFFQKELLERDPPGKFRLPKGWISEHGLVTGERLVFTYKGQCIYQARAASGRIINRDTEREKYPFYFCVDMSSLADAVGSLAILEQELQQHNLLNKRLAQAQGWPSIDETPEVKSIADQLLGKV